MNLDRTKGRTYRFNSVLVGDQWCDDVAISVDGDGTIVEIENGLSIEHSVNTDAVALPGMVNVHSHAFQRAFAGLSEFRTATQDSFWTWRKLMYEFLEQLTPADVYVIAKQLYLEMLAAGYTWAGEFHYLHNDPGGKQHANLPEMSDAVIRAAQETGIGICVIPVLYQRGGFDSSPLSGGQKRFELTVGQFVKVFSRCHDLILPGVRTGVALHSLRAVSVDAARNALDAVRGMTGGGSLPVHIHVAEQMQEVGDCLKAHGKRPVEFLFDQFDVDQRWCLIHATHLIDSEVSLIARSGAVVGLCPTTEANLGDGFFPAEEHLARGGRISIGSDSHINVDWRDELRTLEYGQRLQSQQRAILGTETQSVGRRLYAATCRGGAQALGLSTAGIEVGGRADFTLIDPAHPAIAGARHDRLIDRSVFCNIGNPVCGAMVGGVLFDTRSEEFAERMRESSGRFTALSRRLSRVE